MGKAPVQSGSYATFEGGYLLLDGESAIGHGISTTGLIAGPTIETTVDAEDGWFLGASTGFSSAVSLIDGLPFTRAELFFTYGESDDDRPDTVSDPARTTLKSVDGSALGVIGVTASSEMTRRIAEGGVRLAFDTDAGGGASVTWVMTPFVRNRREDTNSVAIGTVDTAWRSADVETWGYGVTIAAEPEIALASNVALVARIGGGVYGYDTDAKFNSRSSAPTPDPYLAALSESDSGTGFRGVLGLGLKVRVSPGMTLTGFAEADYFSRVANALLPDNQFTTATTSAFEIGDAWEFKAGLRLTTALSSGAY